MLIYYKDNDSLLNLVTTKHTTNSRSLHLFYRQEVGWDSRNQKYQVKIGTLYETPRPAVLQVSVKINRSLL